VERGEVSLGLVGRKVEKPHLEYRFLASDRMLLVVPPGHALGKRKKVTLRQLVSYPLVLRESGSGLRHCFEKSLERAGRSLSELRVVLELGSNEAIKEAVLRGVGVAKVARPLPHVLTYFSFVTLATVGYGDISPVSPATRTLACMEAITGQFYLAVIVAGLVSVLVAKSKREGVP
jgi:DNA-binding transcriptional LysR family regulator